MARPKSKLRTPIRSAQIMIRLTKPELRLIRQHAKTLGVSVSEWTRQMLARGIATDLPS